MNAKEKKIIYLTMFEMIVCNKDYEFNYQKVNYSLFKKRISYAMTLKRTYEVCYCNDCFCLSIHSNTTYYVE
jgi:hypothetical protein